MEVNSFISKTNYLKVTNIVGDNVLCVDVNTGEPYIATLPNLANSYNSSSFDREVEVTREMGRDGRPGIRSIFADIDSSEVFQVTFEKKGKKMTNAEHSLAKANIEVQVSNILTNDTIENKVEAVVEYLKEKTDDIMGIKDNGTRVLIGHKLKGQKESVNGYYVCVDLEKTLENDNPIRNVDIRTIKELIYNNVKYKVK